MATILDFPEVTDLQASDIFHVIRGGVDMAIMGSSILSGITNEDPFKLSTINDGSDIKDIYTYDNNTYRRFTGSNPIDLRFLGIDVVNLPIGWKMHIRQAGTGVITIDPGPDYQVNKLSTDTYSTAGQGASVSLVCVSPGVIDIMGQLATV